MGTPVKGSAQQQSVSVMDETLSMVDYPTIEEMDPSLVDGYTIFYEREVPVELRSASSVDVPTEVGALEALRVKLLVKGQGPQQLDSVRVELSSESNLFFHYMHDLDAAAFNQVQVRFSWPEHGQTCCGLLARRMQESQRLMVEFVDYPSVLLRMLNACIREPHANLAVLLLNPSGEARLDFIQTLTCALVSAHEPQNMEYKFVELLSCKFWASSEEVVRAQVSYRYNVVKARMQLLQARLHDINAIVKVKSPSLLLQLQRTAPRFPPGSLTAPLGTSAGLRH